MTGKTPGWVASLVLLVVLSAVCMLYKHALLWRNHDALVPEYIHDNGGHRLALDLMNHTLLDENISNLVSLRSSENTSSNFLEYCRRERIKTHGKAADNVPFDELFQHLDGVKFKFRKRLHVTRRNCTDIRFSSRSPLPATALASNPGSGNTWTRHLIELITGTYGCSHRTHHWYVWLLS